MQLAKKNHYNPCFWTAHWNPDYLKLAMQDRRSEAEARLQRVFVLNVKSDRIYNATVENVHYDKNFCTAEITPDAIRDFCKRNFPDHYEEFCQDMEGRTETVFLDFENVLTTLEGTPAYTRLLEVIRKGGIGSLQGKGELAGFLLVHHLRSHAMMNSMVEFAETLGTCKFEEFWFLKHLLGNHPALFRLVITLTSGRWYFYRLYEETFPLNDTHILIHPHSVMAALSPRLLLEIDRTDRSCENGWVMLNHISPAKLEEFRRRTIGNTFREIIFGNKALLEQWQASPEFRKRHELMADRRSYNEIVMKEVRRELWKINAFGNAPS